MHLAAVLTHARWPSINCNNLYEAGLVTPGIQVENGSARIPDGPGLGVELDEDAVERYRIEPLTKRREPPTDILLAIRWPSGGTTYYVSARLYRADFLAGKLPVFARGVYMEQIPDDGSRDWKDLNARALRNSSVHTAGRPI